MGESGAPPFHASATYACWWSPSVHDCHDAHSARTDVASLCETDSQPARADISSSLDDRGRARNTRPHSATDGPPGLNWPIAKGPAYSSSRDCAVLLVPTHSGGWSPHGNYRSLPPG